MCGSTGVCLGKVCQVLFILAQFKGQLFLLEGKEMLNQEYREGLPGNYVFRSDFGFKYASDIFL